MVSLLEMRPFVLAFSSSFCTMAEGTQLVAEFVAFPLAKREVVLQFTVAS
jgi:hypothetical protein